MSKEFEQDIFEFHIRKTNKTIRIKYNEHCPVTKYSEFLISNFPDVENKSVIDLGAGSGVLSILSFLLGANSVKAVEKNPNCMGIAMENIQQNDATVNLLSSDEIESSSKDLLGTADIIISNPASLPNIVNKDYCNAGEYGLEMIFDLIYLAEKKLNQNGSLYFIQTSIIPFSLVNNLLKEKGFHYEIIKTSKLLFREFYSPLIPWIKKNEKKYSEMYYHNIEGQFYEELMLYKATK